MPYKQICERLNQSITNQKYFIFSLISVFFLILISFFISWPVVGYDTDLWYHLSGGRYFWEHGAIANDAFFSYITPPKAWYNYYWLFQALIYKIFQWAGYYGLIVLRCLLYCLTVFFICLFFIKGKENRTELLIGLFLLISYALVILYRDLLVRPHLFSYLFIVVFLFILEFRRDKIWLLPLIGILWSNIHGIEYPVMFVIVFAYVAEIYWRQFRNIQQDPIIDKKTKWLLISVFYTIFITPYAVELVKSPFDVSSLTHLYIKEMLRIPIGNFLVFAPITANGFILSLQNIIVLFTVVTILISVFKRNIRISHTIIFVCSFLLLVKSTRFTYEFVLLSIPLLCHGMRLVTVNVNTPRWVINCSLPVLMIVIPLLILSNVFSNRPAYPFSQLNIPTGVVNFLNRHAPGGRILNEPNTGGYLEWALSQKFKIYMDLQMSIFNDTDFATANNAFSDENAFRVFTREYDPSFISASLSRPYFKKVIAGNGDYVPVFFDHKDVLYVKKSHHNDLAASYELKAIDPFNFMGIKYEDEKAEKLAEMFSEASRMREQDPDNYSANNIICSILIVRQQYDQAIFYANVITQHYPDHPQGYALKADALFGMGRYEEAARLYNKALDMGQTGQTENVYRNLYASYVKLKEYKQAYKSLSKFVNPFDLNAGYKDIYELGMSAATVGKFKEAITFLKIARMKAPPTDTEYTQKIQKNLVMLSGDSP